MSSKTTNTRNLNKYSTHPALRVIPLPKDTNGHGNIFGGWLMSQIDLAGAVIAKEVSPRMVTAAVHNIEFLQPILVGDLVSFYGEITKTGTSSIRVSIRVFCKRNISDDYAKRAQDETEVARADITYVNVGKDSKTRPLEQG